MSIATEIERIQNAKTSIKTAIENKGVVVGDGLIDTYASKIDEITGGGGGSESAEIKDCSYLFYYGSRINEVETILPLCKKPTTMKSMFSDCSNLTSLNLSGVNTSDVTDMSYAFYNCKKLATLDLSNFNTKNVTNMDSMFFYCSALKELDTSNINTSKVTNMYRMFYNCSILTGLDLSGFNTSNVTNMSGMFLSCRQLTELDLSSLDTSNVTNMSEMFLSASGLTNLNISNVNTSKVTNMSGLFNTCSKLTELDLSSFDASKVSRIDNMLGGCTALTDLIYATNMGKGFTQKSNNYSYYKNDLSKSTNLTHDSIMSIFNNLYDLNLTYNVANGGTLYTQQLVIGSGNLAKVSADEIAIVTAKGYSVS